MEYSISKVSDITGLSIHTLRYYEKEGLLPKIKRDSSGNRLFSENDLQLLQTITCLKNSEMTIKELKTFIEFYNQGESTLEDRLKIMKEHKLFIREKIIKLNECMDYVDFKIKYFEDAISKLKNE
jgi:DNA-binding transcriptional MerR regulator